MTRLDTDEEAINRFCFIADVSLLILVLEVPGSAAAHHEAESGLAVGAGRAGGQCRNGEEVPVREKSGSSPGI